MTPTTVAPTATTTSTIEKTWAPWLCVDQSLLLFVEFLGEFCVELFESLDDAPELRDESPEDFEESAEPFEEFDPLELGEPPVLDPELLCPEASASRASIETMSVESAMIKSGEPGRRLHRARMNAPSTAGSAF